MVDRIYLFCLSCGFAAVKQYGEIDMNLNLTGPQWRLPYNLYCVGGDVKHCTTNQPLQDDGA